MMTTRIIILILLALLAATCAVAGDSNKYTDWVVECKNSTACEAKTLRQGETTDGYPTIKITGKESAHRNLFLSGAKYVDFSKKISIGIDKNPRIDLKPKRDLKRLNRGEYQVANNSLRNKLLSRMASGRKLQIFYTNVRGQARKPEYSLMGMGAALKRLGGASPAAAVVSIEPGKSVQKQAVAEERVSVKSEQLVDPRSRVKKKFRNWQIRCTPGGACSATTYKMRGSIDGYPVISIVMDKNHQQQLHIAAAQFMNGSKNIWFKIDRNREIRLLSGRDFVRLSKREYKISNSRLLAQIMSAIRRGRTLRLSYLNVRGQWRKPEYSLLGATAAMNELGGAPEVKIAEKAPEIKPRDRRKEVVGTWPNNTRPPIQKPETSAKRNADIAKVIEQNNRKGSTSWWQRIGRSGKKWRVSCSGSYKCVATAQGALKGGKKDISIRVSGGSRSRRFMLTDAGMLDATKPMRIQIDGNLPLHIVPRKDFKNSGRGEVRIINSRLIQTLLAKMKRGDEMWVTYTNRQGRSRVTRFSLNGVNAALKKLGR